jgi:arylsulfatase A-like enzyme
VRDFTESVDIIPTILELAGLGPPGHLDGQALTRYLSGSAPAMPRDGVHWEYDFRDVATGRAQDHFGLSIDALNLAVIRDEHTKYVHFGGGLPPLLFDLDEDPSECVDRAGDAAYQARRLDMAERLLAWRARHLDRTLTGLELTPGGVVDARRG